MIGGNAPRFTSHAPTASTAVDRTERDIVSFVDFDVRLQVPARSNDERAEIAPESPSQVEIVDVAAFGRIVFEP